MKHAYLKIAIITSIAIPNMLFGMAGQTLSSWWSKPGAKAAFVLPYYVNARNKNTYYLVGRETGGQDKGTFSAFGGKANRGEKHPGGTAGREFFEEANLGRLGWNKQKTQQFIRLNNGQTRTIIALTRPITAIYITNLGDAHARNLLKKFNYATNRDKEMNQLAEIRHDRLVTALRKARSAQNITVEATVWAQGKFQGNKRITLRPLTFRLKPYFTGGRYTRGTDSRIRFY